MKPVVLFILLLLSGYYCHAQKVRSDSFIAIKYSPLSLLEFKTPVIQFAIEKRVGYHSYQVQLAPRIPQYYAISDTMSDEVLKGYAWGFKVRVEVRQYFCLDCNPDASYFAVEVFYTKNHCPITGEYKSRDYDLFRYDDAFVIKKNMFGIAIKIGHQERFGKHFLIDAYIGLGLKYKMIGEKGKYNREDFDTVRHPNVESGFAEVGNFMTAAIPANFMIGYVF